jgi:uncharacterized NAD(P)/FAD-binding protein YdhS
LTHQNALTEPKKNQNADNSNKDSPQLIMTQEKIEIKLGRLTVIKGEVNSVSVSDEEVILNLADGSQYSGEYLAITIGREYEISDPLTLNMISEKFASRGPLGMGLSVDVSTGLLLNINGVAYPSIYAIGPLRSGEAFESTAIPEIRKQATLIASSIVNSQSNRE